MLAPARRGERFRQRLLGYLQAAFGERLRRSGIADVDALSAFLRTRSAYIAQTALYGYLKTRMGTSFRRHFEDEGFADVIHGSTVKLYASCLSDLTVFAAATAARDAALTDEERAGLARHCFREAFHAGLAEVAARHRPEGAADRFEARLRLTDWAEAAVRESAFHGSVGDLLRYAPVVDEFKHADEAIVRNSIRFRWRDVREQLRRRLDAPALADDWRRLAGREPGAGPPGFPLSRE